MKNFLIVLFFISLSNYSFSQSDEDFVYIGSNTKNHEYYVYIEKTNYLSTDAWIKTVEPTKTIKNKKGKYVETGGKYTLTFISMYCSNKEYDIKQQITYSLKGEVLSSTDFPKFGQKVIPGSVMSSICDHICSEDDEVE